MLLPIVVDFIQNCMFYIDLVYEKRARMYSTMKEAPEWETESILFVYLAVDGILLSFRLVQKSLRILETPTKRR